MKKNKRIFIKYGETFAGKKEYSSIRIDLAIEKDLKDSQNEQEIFIKEFTKLKRNLKKLKKLS